MHMAKYCCAWLSLACTVKRKDPSVPVEFFSLLFPLGFFFFLIFVPHLMVIFFPLSCLMSFCSLVTYLDLAKKAEKTGPVGSSLHLWLNLLISVTSYVCAVGSMHFITTSANSAEHG